MPALPSPGSSRVREPLCADDGASVDADARLSSVPSPYSRCRTAADITACLGDPVGNCGSPIGVHAGRCPCGGRKCGVDLSVENVDRPRPDQQRRSILPAGVPSTSSTGHPRGACRDKAQRRGSASGRDSRVLDAETERHGALCTPGNPITCASGRRPRHLGAASICSFPAPCRTGIPPSWIFHGYGRGGLRLTGPRFRSWSFCPWVGAWTDCRVGAPGSTLRTGYFPGRRDGAVGGSDWDGQCLDGLPAGGHVGGPGPVRA